MHSDPGRQFGSRSLPERARASGAAWDGWQMLAFGADVLVWMRCTLRGLEAAQQGDGQDPALGKYQGQTHQAVGQPCTAVVRFTYDPGSSCIQAGFAPDQSLGPRLAGLLQAEAGDAARVPEVTE
jgi:hypothetical protein